ncbi:MAG: DUF234 domain-containing protein [Methanocalculus sp.]|uniref:DUF234 domain-containing protein n=1 Tax=Methanocalculus sp. TaxID=2004547 RepID=UPI002722E6C7|nr:DUF234 domain-containing protein [Methanocalculus sp.]MDO9539336.1 DUF234 domain-containing protein [Methanocalculus sp.]
MQLIADQVYTGDQALLLCDKITFVPSCPRFYARYIYRNRSLYQAGRYEKLLSQIKTELKGFSGFAFEEMVQTLHKNRLIPEYDTVGSWWNRRGDEIDLLTISEGADLALEIKNCDLTHSEYTVSSLLWKRNCL